MQTAFLILASVLFLDFAVRLLSDGLNLRNFSDEPPPEFKDRYDAHRYRKAREYHRENFKLWLVQRTLAIVLILVLAGAGGFNQIDAWAWSLGLSPVWTGVAFMIVLSVGQSLFSLPFSIYDTFVIEEKYGFNRTTPKVFVLDRIKGTVLSALLGIPILAAILWFFDRTGASAWLYAWAFMSAFQILITLIAPRFLMPLFNKFNTVPPGDLRSEIEAYARRENFELEGVYTMDGSKRSTKANAFFAGFGKFRRLVLFDTLIEKHSREELMAVLAHEVGHFKRGHIPKFMILSVLSTGALFFVLSRLLEWPLLPLTLGIERSSVHVGLVALAILFAPFGKLFSIATHWMSRKFEFESDEFSARSYGNPGALASALKKLSSDNLSNLTPHPLKVWLDYTHPPVIERIRALTTRSARGP